MPREAAILVRRLARHRRVRRKVRGTEQRPRLSVFRSLRHIHAQIVDDSKGVTLVAASSVEPEVAEQRQRKPKSEASRLVGRLVASRAAAKGIKQVVFDRGGYKYHGRAKVLADAAREGGLVF